MAKIPKNLSDKDMFKDWHEEATVEEQLLAAAKKEDTERSRAERNAHSGQDIRIAYLTPDIVDTLGRLLLELKLDLSKEGVLDYRVGVRREGRRIILEPIESGHAKKR